MVFVRPMFQTYKVFNIQDDRIPLMIKNALADLAPDQAYNGCFFDVCPDILLEYDNQEVYEPVYKWFVENGVQPDEYVLIRYWW